MGIDLSRKKKTTTERMIEMYGLPTTCSFIVRRQKINLFHLSSSWAIDFNSQDDFPTPTLSLFVSSPFPEYGLPLFQVFYGSHFRAMTGCLDMSKRTPPTPLLIVWAIVSIFAHSVRSLINILSEVNFSSETSSFKSSHFVFYFHNVLHVSTVAEEPFQYLTCTVSVLIFFIWFHFWRARDTMVTLAEISSHRSLSIGTKLHRYLKSFAFLHKVLSCFYCQHLDLRLTDPESHCFGCVRTLLLFPWMYLCAYCQS